MTVRKVVTRRSSHFRGYFPSLKNGRPIPWESQLEGLFLCLLELSPLVFSYMVQPSKETFLLDGKLTTYYPDVRAHLCDGKEHWFEVKPASRLLNHQLKHRMSNATERFEQTHRKFSVITDAVIGTEPLSDNLRELMYYRRGPLLDAVGKANTFQSLELYKPRTISDLCSVFGDVFAWRLLGLGVVGVNLEKSLSQESEVFLDGGHRHGDLFA